MSEPIVCPVCSGEGKQVGIFPVYAPGTPPENKRPYIEVNCSFCRASGYVDDAAMERRAHGQKMREERLSRQMGLRAESERLGISPSVLSRMEQGIEETP